MSKENKKEETKTKAPAKDLPTDKTGKATDAEAPKTEEPKAEEKPAEKAPKEEPKEEAVPVEVPEKFKKIVEEIEKMSVMELNELVKVFEKKFGVSAQAVAAASAVGAGSNAGAEEQSSFAVELTEVGGQKIAVIKVVKSLLGLGLKEAKDAVDGVPTVLKEGVKKEEAENIKKQIEEAGGTVTLK